MKKALLIFGLVLFSASAAFARGPHGHARFHRPPAIHRPLPPHRPTPHFIHHRHHYGNFVLGGLAAGIGSAVINNILWQNSAPETTVITAPAVPVTTTTTTVITTAPEPAANSVCHTRYIAPNQWVWDCTSGN